MLELPPREAGEQGNSGQQVDARGWKLPRPAPAGPGLGRHGYSSPAPAAAIPLI